MGACTSHKIVVDGFSQSFVEFWCAFWVAFLHVEYELLFHQVIPKLLGMCERWVPTVSHILETTPDMLIPDSLCAHWRSLQNNLQDIETVPNNLNATHKMNAHLVRAAYPIARISLPPSHVLL